MRRLTPTTIQLALRQQRKKERRFTRISRNQIDIHQQSHSGRDEEEGHAGKEIVPHRIKMTFLDDTEEKSQQRKHHPDDRTGNRKLKALAQQVTGEGEGENDSKLKKRILTASLL